MLRFCGIRKSFLRQIWGVAYFGTAQAAIRKSFLRENRIFHHK